MTRVLVKSKSCEGCGYVFDDIKKYHSKNRCNPCYQKDYVKKSLPTKKDKETNCSECNGKYGTLNDKGKAIVRGPKGLCKKCYGRNKKPKKECIECGNMMLAGSNTGLCAVCKERKRAEKGGRRWVKKVKPLPVLDIETYEAVRRLLVRYKYGTNTLVDNFRVADIYMDINENSILLDTLTEEVQVVEMLKNLKVVFDFNKENRTEKLLEEKIKAERKAKYYKYKKKEKKVNKTADMKEYMREYRAKYKLLGKRD